MELQNKISEVIQNYNIDQQIKELSLLTEQTISEKQFAQLIGKSRLYNYLPKEEKKELPELLLNDSHISAIAKEYYNDKNFCRNFDGTISLWRLYNLMTGSNKASYVDTFLERGVNAFNFSKGVSKALSDGNSDYAWFLS
jgi:hypothetical protein